jgi:chromosome segregation ATPase
MKLPPVSRSDSGRSKIETLNIEAETVLSRKNQEIQGYQDAIEEAEQLLAKLKSELESKAALFSAEVNDGGSDDSGEEEGLDLDKLKSELDAELNGLTAKHQEEVASLSSQYTATLKDAEQWAEEHAESAYLEKVAELEGLKKELKAFREQTDETAFAQAESRTRALMQSKNTAIENRRRIQELEDQLAELGATAREELRVVRAKVDECLTAVELRDREHQSEIQKYEREATDRDEQYNAHLQVLAEQFQSERQRVERQLAAAMAKGDNVRKVLAQLHRHHEVQIETTRRDNERMKSTILQSKTRDEQLSVNTKSFVSRAQTTQNSCRRVEQDIALVNDEIKELQEENRELEMELRRLDPATARKTVGRLPR